MTSHRRTRTKNKRTVKNTFQQLSGQAYSPYSPMPLLTDEQIVAIHQASLKVLCDTGMDFQSPKAVSILKQAGAQVDNNHCRVRFDPAWIMEKIKLAPSHFTLHGRDPKHNLSIGKKAISYGMVASTPNVSDLDRGRVTGNFADYCNLIRLGEMLNAVDFQGGYPVEPCDIDVNVRHLVAGAAAARLTTKPLGIYALGGQRTQDMLAIMRIVRGIDENTLKQQPSTMTVVNANSPLIYDAALLEGAMEMAKYNQPVIYTPFTLAGAMAPITLAGALVQQNAECLAGIAFHQCVNPGAPVVYGSFTSNVDMKSGSPAFGTPEYTQATIASGQLARFYNLPSRASNANASNATDAQATYESQMSLWACMMGQINIVFHALGWQEGGLCTSYEKVILDAEMIQMHKAFMQPMPIDAESLATEAISEVGPGSHFFASPHTLQRYENAFYTPLLSDWRNFENWRDAGSINTTQRANQLWKKMLQDYQTPALSQEIEEELTAFVEKRTHEGGATPGQ